MKEIIRSVETFSPEETQKVASSFASEIEREAKNLSGGVVFIALYGDVGVGKTVFVKGLASVLCPDEFVQSPTYAIVNEYRGGVRVCHFDMYRVNSEDDLESVGFYDYNGCVIVAEWCENVPYALPRDYYRVEIQKLDDGDGRTIAIEKITGAG